MLCRRTGDPDRAEDLAQEVFLRALEAPPRNPRSWLFAVALNLARDDGRRAERQERRLQLFKAEQDGAAAPSPDAALERSERAALVREALDRLSETDRGALLLKTEGLSYEDIASALGLSPGAIGTTLARARRRLVETVRALERGDDGPR
jgi:RNA polymerase sigma-70 factor (ECF subfamily)